MSDLITTKFMVSALPSTLVEHEHLLERLVLRPTTKLVLVSAPAGSGKSILLATWLRGLDRRAAWLSLEPNENDLNQFLLYLIGALQQPFPAFGQELAARLQMQSLVAAEPFMIRLVNELINLTEPLVLVLDDFHILNNPAIHAAVVFLLDHLPPHLCIAIATRTDPPFALGRLRVQGQLLEVRGDGLRFGLEASERLLNEKFGLALPPEAIAHLHARTEGWVAGLQLAAVSLVSQPNKEALIAAFAGSHRYLVDYLVDEVLDRQTLEVRRFLQHTSILLRFTASLCEAVTEQPVDPALLKELEAANLFLVPLDVERIWYRYHHLFAEFLRHRLWASEPGEIPALHLRASRWFEDHGWTNEAIQHAFLAGDQARGAQLIENVAFELGVYWNNAQLIRYVQCVPPALLPLHPRLLIYYTWALTNTFQIDALEATLPLLEASAAHAAEPRTVTSCLFTLRAYERLRKLDFEGALAHCQEALAQLEPPSEQPSNEERWLRVAATNLIAYTYLHCDLRHADALYPTALDLSQKLGNLVGTLNGFARKGRVKHQLGQLQTAMVAFQQGLSTLARWRTQEGWKNRIVNAGELQLYLARLLYEWNRLGEAETYLQQARALNELAQFPPIQALQLRTIFLLHQARGESEGARAALFELERLGREINPDNLFVREIFEVTAMELRLLLAAATPSAKDLLDTVTAWVRRQRLAATDAFSYPYEKRYYVLANLTLLNADAEGALVLLERLAGAAQAEGRVDDEIRYCILQALAARRLGRRSQALRRALELGEAQGYLRSFLDAGPHMRKLLEALAKDEPTPYLTELLAAFADPANKVPAPAPFPANLVVEPDAIPMRLEPLSERERMILRRLALGESNKEIAKKLGLSPHTVKWYVQNLYEKLGVSNRMQAVNRAKDLGLYS